MVEPSLAIKQARVWILGLTLEESRDREKRDERFSGAERGQGAPVFSVEEGLSIWGVGVLRGTEEG